MNNINFNNTLIIMYYIRQSEFPLFHWVVVSIHEFHHLCTLIYATIPLVQELYPALHLPLIIHPIF